MSSVLQAGPCVRSNQLDYDEDVMYKVRPFATLLTTSVTEIIARRSVLRIEVTDTSHRLNNTCMIMSVQTRRVVDLSH